MTHTKKLPDRIGPNDFSLTSELLALIIKNQNKIIDFLTPEEEKKPIRTYCEEGCDCPKCHNTEKPSYERTKKYINCSYCQNEEWRNPLPPSESWENRFDKKFPPVSQCSQRQGDYTETPIPHIKAFIKNELSSQHSTFIQMVEEKRIKKTPDVQDGYHKKIYYNRCVDDLLSSLNNL